MVVICITILHFTEYQFGRCSEISEMDEMNEGAVYGLTLKLYDMEIMWYQL